MSNSDDKKPIGMKSAYELALERMEARGIERPREEALSEEARREVADLRQKTEAKLAELEILHKDRLKTTSHGERPELEEEYRRERRRLEEDRDRKIARLREGGSTS